MGQREVQREEVHQVRQVPRVLLDQLEEEDNCCSCCVADEEEGSR